METKNKQKTLKEKVGDTFIFGVWSFLALSFGTNLYLAGKQIHDVLTANAQTRQSYEQARERGLATINGTMIYGYDLDKDGSLDEIKECWSWVGSHAAAPCERIYKPADKEFKELNAILMGNK